MSPLFSIIRNSCLKIHGSCFLLFIVISAWKATLYHNVHNCFRPAKDHASSKWRFRGTVLLSPGSPMKCPVHKQHTFLYDIYPSYIHSKLLFSSCFEWSLAFLRGGVWRPRSSPPILSCCWLETAMGLITGWKWRSREGVSKVIWFSSGGLDPNLIAAATACEDCWCHTSAGNSWWLSHINIIV